MAVSASARLGYFFIFLVAVDWILASYLVQDLERERVPPFIITTVCNSLFLLCLFVHWGNKWCAPRRPLHPAHPRHSVASPACERSTPPDVPLPQLLRRLTVSFPSSARPHFQPHLLPFTQLAHTPGSTPPSPRSSAASSAARSAGAPLRPLRRCPATTSRTSSSSAPPPASACSGSSANSPSTRAWTPQTSRHAATAPCPASIPVFLLTRCPC